MSDFSKLKTKKNGKEYVLNACTQDTEQNITGTKNFTKLTVNSKNVVTSINGINADTDGDIKLAGGSKELGEIFYSTIPMDNVNYHLLDGTILDGNAEEYKQFYNYLLSIKPTNSNLFIAEEEYQTQLNDKGVCGKYVLDEVNKTIRLPKITGFIEGTVDSSALGQTVDAGLPNIEGEVGQLYLDSSIRVGAFKTTQVLSNGSAWLSGGSNMRFQSMYFDASNSNSIYGNSETVQPQSIKLFVYVVVNNGSVEDAPLDVTKEYQLNNPFSLFDYRYVSHRLNNASWVLSTNTFLSGDLYPTAYEKLLAELAESSIGLSVKNASDVYTDYDYVVDTENNSFRLPLVIKERVLVESKVATDEDPTWYNLYSDGWCEQGGRIANNANAVETITFSKPFKNTNYSILKQLGSSESGNPGDKHVSFFNLTTTTAQTYSGIPYVYQRWYACGYAQDKPTTNLYFYLGDTVSNPNLIELGFVQDRIGRVERKIGNLSKVGGMPDYSTAVTYPITQTEQTLVIPYNCLLNFDSAGFANVYCTLYIDDTLIIKRTTNSNAYIVGCNYSGYVKKGSIVKYKSGYGNGSSFVSTNLLTLFNFI